MFRLHRKVNITSDSYSAHGAPARGRLPVGVTVEDHAHLLGRSGLGSGLGPGFGVGSRVLGGVGVGVRGWGWAGVGVTLTLTLALILTLTQPSAEHQLLYAL